MADDVDISPGLGVTIAADDVGGKHHQRVKVSIGDDGSAADASDRRPVPVRPGRPTTTSLTNVPVSASASGDNALVAATAAQTTRVFRLLLVAAGAVSLKLRSGTTDLMAAIPLAAGGSIVLDFDGEPWFETAANEALNLNLSAAVPVTGFLQHEKSVP